MRSVVGRIWRSDFGRTGSVNETPIFQTLNSNPGGKNAEGQCLTGSLNGAFSSKKVTEEFIKVGLARMEIGLDVQTQKPA